MVLAQPSSLRVHVRKLYILWAQCTHLGSTLRPKYILFGYMDHGPLWPEPNAPRTHPKPHEMLIRCGSFMRRNSSGCGRSWRNAWPCLCTWPAAHTNTHNDREREREQTNRDRYSTYMCICQYVHMYIRVGAQEHVLLKGLLFTWL